MHMYFHGVFYVRKLYAWGEVGEAVLAALPTLFITDDAQPWRTHDTNSNNGDIYPATGIRKHSAPVTLLAHRNNGTTQGGRETRGEVGRLYSNKPFPTFTADGAHTHDTNAGCCISYPQGRAEKRKQMQPWHDFLLLSLPYIQTVPHSHISCPRPKPRKKKRG